jgi:hypothetical protein
MPRTLGPWSVRLLLTLPASALVLAACSSSPSDSSSTTSTTSARSTTPTTTPASTTSSTSQTSGTLVPQSSTVTEFYSPSKNISCEIDYDFGSDNQTNALCLTLSPPKSVTLTTDSSLAECTGVNCLSNAGENTPTLAYGQSITLGPLTCASSTAGMKCTLANGDGFLISSSAITTLGNAKVMPSSG